jgi:hypothetical protein
MYNRKYNGLGIGLTISNSLVHQLGGVMGVRSELGKGSEFYFTLPNTKPLVKSKKIKGIVKKRLIPASGWFDEVIKQTSDHIKRDVEIYPNQQSLST